MDTPALTAVAIVALDLLATLSVLGSTVSTGRKALWIVVILLLPLLGFLVWLAMGPRFKRQSS